MPNMPCISPCIYQRSSGIYPCYKQHLQWKILEFCFGNHSDTLTFLSLSPLWCQKWTTILFQNSINGYIPTHCCIWLAHPVLNLAMPWHFVLLQLTENKNTSDMTIGWKLKVASRCQHWALVSSWKSYKIYHCDKCLSWSSKYMEK